MKRSRNRKLLWIALGIAAVAIVARRRAVGPVREVTGPDGRPVVDDDGRPVAIDGLGQLWGLGDDGLYFTGWREADPGALGALGFSFKKLKKKVSKAVKSVKKTVKKTPVLKEVAKVGSKAGKLIRDNKGIVLTAVAAAATIGTGGALAPTLIAATAGAGTQIFGKVMASKAKKKAAAAQRKADQQAQAEEAAAAAAYEAEQAQAQQHYARVEPVAAGGGGGGGWWDWAQEPAEVEAEVYDEGEPEAYAYDEDQVEASSQPTKPRGFWDWLFQ